MLTVVVDIEFYGLTHISFKTYTLALIKDIN